MCLFVSFVYYCAVLFVITLNCYLVGFGLICMRLCLMIGVIIDCGVFGGVVFPFCVVSVCLCFV